MEQIRGTSGAVILAACLLAVPGCDTSGKAGEARAGAASDASGRHSTLAGVYTAEQATYGKDVYEQFCYSCHLALNNHAGPVFRQHWAGRGLSEFFTYISVMMPKNDPGTLSPDDNAALTAYLLQLNGMPAGNVAMATDTTKLRAIRIDTAGSKR